MRLRKDIRRYRSGPSVALSVFVLAGLAKAQSPAPAPDAPPPVSPEVGVPSDPPAPAPLPPPAPVSAEPIAPLPPPPSPAVNAEVSAEVGADTATSDAEAEALAAALGSDSAETAVAEAEEFKLNVYGFTDFTYTHVLNDFTYASPYPTFMVGNVNLYVGAELGAGFRSLLEFRLLYVPHGNLGQPAAFGDASPRQDTSVADPADFGRPLRWGGVEIERAYLEYVAHPLLTLRGGQWLTPYGIWNVDHGSPVIIGVRRPYVVGEALIPERQTGIMAYGSGLVGSTEIGYALGLSNGRGPVDSYNDLDNNKAVTARLFVSKDLPGGGLTVGATAFRGRFTDRSYRFAVSPAGEAGVEYLSVNRYEEFSVSGDVRWTWNDLTVQGEFMMRQQAIDDRFRAAGLLLANTPPGWVPDFTSVGYYAMVAYRLPWLNIMPFFGSEQYYPNQEMNFDAMAIWGGLNVRPTPRVVLKGQFTRSWFLGDGFPTVGDDGIEAIDLQASWSF